MSEPDPAARYRVLFDEMRLAWERAPLPSLAANATQVTVWEAQCLAVAHSWLAHLFRTNAAALALDSSGFALEAAPLRRLSVETLMRLHWLARDGGAAMQSITRAHQYSLQRVVDAQAGGWKIQVLDLDDKLDAVLGIATEASTLRLDFMQGQAGLSRALDLGREYQAWLIETLVSHAALATANHFHTWVSDTECQVSRVPTFVPSHTAMHVVWTTLEAVRVADTLGIRIADDDLARSWRSRSSEIGDAYNGLLDAEIARLEHAGHREGPPHP